MQYGKSKHATGQLRDAAANLLVVLREDDGALDWQSLFFLGEALESCAEIVLAFPEEITALSPYGTEAGNQASSINAVAATMKALSESIRTG